MSANSNTNNSNRNNNSSSSNNNNNNNNASSNFSETPRPSTAPDGPIFSCKRCKKVFPCKRDQMLHKKEVHCQTKSHFECKICSKFFCNNGNLERHMKVHQDIRPFVCRICEKAFAQAVNLQRHYSVHNGERPYQCNFCTKAFTQQSNMQRHQLTHTGEKPFRCKRCGRYFSQRVNLKKHIMGHLNTKPYGCKICQKAFIQLANFKRHLQTHIKEGLEVDVAASVDAAAQAFKQGIELAQQPVAFECAICRSVFDNFADFEMHENDCNGDGQTPHTPTLPSQQQQQQQQQHQQQQQRNNVQSSNVPTYPLRFDIPHLNTHDLIIESSR